MHVGVQLVPVAGKLVPLLLRMLGVRCVAVATRTLTCANGVTRGAEGQAAPISG